MMDEEIARRRLNRAVPAWRWFCRVHREQRSRAAYGGCDSNQTSEKIRNHVASVWFSIYNGSGGSARSSYEGE
jgi:hypothetical protein